MSLNEFLMWISNSGGGAMVASWILEQFAWYQGLVLKTKQLVFFGVTLVITIAGFLVITYVPSTVLDAVAPYFLIVYTAVGSILLGSGFHKATKKDPK